MERQGPEFKKGNPGRQKPQDGALPGDGIEGAQISGRRSEGLELPSPALDGQTYCLRPGGGYPWTVLQAERGLSDDDVRARAVEAFVAHPLTYPLAPNEYEARLRSAEVVTLKSLQAALEAEEGEKSRIRRQAEILANVTSGRNSREPAAWVGEVTQEVAFALGLQEEGQPNAAVAPYVRQAIALTAENVWIKCSENPVDAARHVQHFHMGPESLKEWAASHPKFQDAVESWKDRDTSLPEAEAAAMAYMGFVDKAGIAMLDSLTGGTGNLNPKIPLDSVGLPESCTDLGGYPLYYVTADGGVLSPEAVRENQALTNDPDDKQWYVVRAEVNYEDPDLYCEHTGERIPSAYAEPEDVEAPRQNLESQIGTQGIEVYDNGGATFDRYTVVFKNSPEGNGLYASLGMSERPGHPQGFGQHSTAEPGSHLGRRIQLAELPEECRNLVIRELEQDQGNAGQGLPLAQVVDAKVKDLQMSYPVYLGADDPRNRVEVQGVDGRPLTFRLLMSGSRYGNGSAIWNYEGVGVEVYDSKTTNNGSPLGQVISQYEMSTLRRHKGGLCLDGGNRDIWSINEDQLQKALAYLTARNEDAVAAFDHDAVMRHLPVRACSIFNKDNPEWGTFGVMQDRGGDGYYEIHGSGGSRVLSKAEAVQFWDLGPVPTLKIKNNPAEALGAPLNKIDSWDWDECYPVIRDEVVVGVCLGSGEALAGEPGSVYDEARDYFIPKEVQMVKHTTSEILDAVGEKIANGHGFTRKGKTDYFDSTVEVEGVAYRVKVAWPDGAEAHELDPEIEEA